MPDQIVNYIKVPSYPDRTGWVCFFSDAIRTAWLDPATRASLLTGLPGNEGGQGHRSMTTKNIFAQIMAVAPATTL